MLPSLFSSRLNPLSTRGVGKPTSSRVGDSPSLAIQAHLMARKFGPDFSVDVIYATTPQKRGVQAPHRLFAFVIESKYSQPVTDETKDAIGTRVSTTLQGQSPSPLNLDQRADLSLYF